MARLALLRSLPTPRRNLQQRETAKSPEVIAAAKLYGELYFDGPRDYGYGGYRYDGRWLPVARDIIRHYRLGPGDRVLDIGCAKGFLVRDLMAVCPGLEAVGLDISDYALSHAHPEAAGYLVRGNAEALPFADNSFQCVLSLNTLHNLPRPRLKTALQEIGRVGCGPAFIQVDSYLTAEQKAVFESWVLTAAFYDYPEGWLALFAEAGYEGDYDWTIIS